MVMMSSSEEKFSKSLMLFIKERNLPLLTRFHCNIGSMIILSKTAGRKYTLMNRKPVTYIVMFHKKSRICVPLELTFT